MKLNSILIALSSGLVLVHSRAALFEARSLNGRNVESTRLETRSRAIHVKAGQSIQTAIDSANPGDTIIVGAGTYAEQLTIKTTGLSLIGQGAILVVPDTAVKNVCNGLAGAGTLAGICVAGSGIKLAPYVTEHRKVLSVKKPVQGVSVTGFEVQGFNGSNIMVVGAEDARIASNTLVDGVTYGFLTAGSYNSQMISNTVTSSDASNPGFIALCMDNFEGAFASNNVITNYVVGLCIETQGAVLQQNSVSSTCNGAYVDPDTDGVKLSNNQIGASYTECGGFGSYGIVLDGPQHTLVYGNVIENQHNDGPAAGLYVSDDPCTEASLTCPVAGQAAVASGNVVVGNTFIDNDLDIDVVTTGTGNVFKKNHCSTSTPKGLCKK